MLNISLKGHHYDEETIVDPVPRDERKGVERYWVDVECTLGVLERAGGDGKRMTNNLMFHRCRGSLSRRLLLLHDDDGFLLGWEVGDVLFGVREGLREQRGGLDASGRERRAHGFLHLVLILKTVGWSVAENVGQLAGEGLLGGTQQLGHGEAVLQAALFLLGVLDFLQQIVIAVVLEGVVGRGGQDVGETASLVLGGLGSVALHVDIGFCRDHCLITSGFWNGNLRFGGLCGHETVQTSIETYVSEILLGAGN